MMKTLLLLLLSVTLLAQESLLRQHCDKPRTFIPSYSSLTGIGLQTGVSRRDPSEIFLYNGYYYVYYTKILSTDPYYPNGYFGDIWGAKSADGVNWTEFGKVIAKGTGADPDIDGVFTPSVLIENDTFYIVYHYSPPPFVAGLPTTRAAIAYATHPESTFTKWSGNPINSPSTDPKEFDSQLVDGDNIVKWNGKYWLLYKGRQQGLSPDQTRQGVAYADKPLSVFTKYSKNPVIQSGHEIMTWIDKGKVYVMTGNQGYSSIDRLSVFSSSDMFNWYREVVYTGFINGITSNAPSVFRQDIPIGKGSLPYWGVYHIGDVSPPIYIGRWDAIFTND